MVNWITSFLTSRSQRVKIHNSISESKPVLSGIPQGSVLGPLLFVIFINDLPSVCRDLGNVYLFADDAKMYKCIKSKSDYNMLNKCCKNIFAWSENWLMKLNISKCKVLTICSSRGSAVRNDYGFDVPNRGFVPLEHEESIKDLGVLMDCHFAFDKHICDKISTANRMLGILKRNFVDLDKHSFILLYKSMVRSHLEYSASLWNPYKQSTILALEKVQKRATKAVRVCRDLSYIDRLKLLQLPSLVYRRHRGDMIEVYKILHEFYDSDVVPSLQLCQDTRTRGNSLKLQVHRCKRDIRKYSFCNRVVSLWNALPDYVVTSPSLNMFKNNIDRHWKHEDFYFDFKARPPSGLLY